MVGWKMRSADVICMENTEYGKCRVWRHLRSVTQTGLSRTWHFKCLNKLAESNLSQHSQQFWHRTTAEHVDIALISIKHSCVTARESMLPRRLLDFCCLYRRVSIGNFSAEKWVVADFEGVYPPSAAAAACLVLQGSCTAYSATRLCWQGRRLLSLDLTL